jgi:chemotaxis protein MotB
MSLSRSHSMSLEEGEGDSYLASLSDLMVGMLFIFIIMLMAFALTYRSAQDTSEDKSAQLQTQLQKEQQAEQEAHEAEKRAELQAKEAQDAKKKAEDELARARALSSQRDAERRQLKAQNDFLARAQSVLTESDQIRRSMLRRLRDALLAEGVQVAIDEDNGILRLPDEILFNSGESVLQSGGVAKLQRLASVLLAVVPCYAHSDFQPSETCPQDAKPILEALYIEGHTDDVPIAKGNWALSTERAVHTFEAMIQSEPSLSKVRNGSGASLLGVSGYGEERPAYANETAEGRAHNRRIDLRFLLAAPSPEDLERMRLKAIGDAEVEDRR